MFRCKGINSTDEVSAQVLYQKVQLLLCLSVVVAISRQRFVMDRQQRTVVAGFTISVIGWLLLVCLFVFLFLRDISTERGEPFTNEDLIQIAVDFKYFAIVVVVGTIGFLLLVARKTTRRQKND